MEDLKLSDHFTLFELTRTDRDEFRDKNRELTETQFSKLKDLAELLEKVRLVLDTPLIIHSGYRCAELNAAVGSNARSQHLLCEAADFMPGQQDLGFAFRSIWKKVKDGELSVGQVIFETAARPYGQTSWIHISLGSPYRDEARCGQILRMENGIYSRLA